MGLPSPRNRLDIPVDVCKNVYPPPQPPLPPKPPPPQTPLPPNPPTLPPHPRLHVQDLIAPVLIFQCLEQYDFVGATVIGTVLLGASLAIMLCVNQLQQLSQRYRK